MLARFNVCGLTLALVFVVGCSESIDSIGDEMDPVVQSQVPVVDSNGISSLSVDATRYDQWTRLSFRAGIVDEGDDWDLAFRRFVIRLNGGSSGRGTAIGQFFSMTELSQIGALPDSGWLTDDADLVFADWYSYDHATRILTTVKGIWSVRTGDGQGYYGVEIISYYGEAGDSGVYSLKWKELTPPVNQPDLIMGFGELPEELDNPMSNEASSDGDSDASSSADMTHFGCYSGPPEHSCDCALDVSECDASGGVWTEHCECDNGASSDR